MSLRELQINLGLKKSLWRCWITINIKELTTEEIISIVEPITTQIRNFDSDATIHITFYQDDFSIFQFIIAKVLSFANKQKLSVVGKKELVLDLPNSVTFSKLYLSKVLYSFKTRYTLVLIKWLDNTTFSIIFTNKKCIMYNVGGSWVAKVSWNRNKLLNWLKR